MFYCTLPLWFLFVYVYCRRYYGITAKHRQHQLSSQLSSDVSPLMLCTLSLCTTKEGSFWCLFNEADSHNTIQINTQQKLWFQCNLHFPSVPLCLWVTVRHCHTCVLAVYWSHSLGLVTSLHPASIHKQIPYGSISFVFLCPEWN